MARSGSVSPVPSSLPAILVARLVGLRRRHAGGFWLSLHGPAVLGAGVARAADDRGGGWPSRPSRIDSALAHRALRISRPRSAAGREVDLVPGRQAPGNADTGAVSAVQERSALRR